MTIYYLYVKTHNITGLKYLGKTIQNPHKYRGSGKKWKSHIRKHGYNVTTEILKECSSDKELKEWGLYYSRLWNIVEARDENGNKLWANLKPENGDGGSTSEIQNRPEVIQKRKDKFKDPVFKEKHSMAVSNALNSPEIKEKHRISMKLATNTPEYKAMKAQLVQDPEYKEKRRITESKPETKVRRSIAQKISQNRPEVKNKLSGSNNYNYDHTKYIFIHDLYGQEYCTTRELINKYALHQSSISLLINNKQRTHKGWSLHP